MTDVVLVHGTTQSAEGWRPLVRALEARGVAAHAVDLPADRPELRAEDYATLVGQRLGGLLTPTVVAHSACGLLLPAIARRLGASRQVWLAAWVPDPAASLAEEIDAHAEEAFDPGWLGTDATADPEAASRLLFHDCDPATRNWALTTLRLFLPRAAYEQRIGRADGIASTYVVAARDRTIRPSWQRRLARERLHVEPLELPSGHCPHVSRPEELAELLAAG